MRSRSPARQGGENVTEPKKPVDPRGFRPENPKLTWKLVLAAIPLYTGTYFLVILAVALVVAPQYQRLAIAAGVTLVSLTFLDMWLKPRMGLKKAEELRERTWATPADMGDLILRQAGRYLIVALPIIVLCACIASLLVTAFLKAVNYS